MVWRQALGCVVFTLQATGSLNGKDFASCFSFYLHFGLVLFPCLGETAVSDTGLSGGPPVAAFTPVPAMPGEKTRENLSLCGSFVFATVATCRNCILQQETLQSEL